MDNRFELAAAVDELERLLRLSSLIPDDLSPIERGEALRLRRAITEQNAHIVALGDLAFPAAGEQAAFRDEVKELRTAISAHLSDWPISGIDADEPAYAASLRRLRQAYRTFIGATRRRLRTG